MSTAQFSCSADLGGKPGDIWDAMTDVGRVVGWDSIAYGTAGIEPLGRNLSSLHDRLGPFKLRAGSQP